MIEWKNDMESWNKWEKGEKQEKKEKKGEGEKLQRPLEIEGKKSEKIHIHQNDYSGYT